MEPWTAPKGRTWPVLVVCHRTIRIVKLNQTVRLPKHICHTADAPASCTTTSLSLYVISYQRSLSVTRESQQQTQLLGSVVLLPLKCSYLVLSLKASAKVQQFSEPPKLFRSFFLKNYRNRLQYIIFNDSTPYYYIIT